jgi:ribosomal protein S20
MKISNVAHMQKLYEETAQRALDNRSQEVRLNKIIKEQKSKVNAAEHESYLHMVETLNQIEMMRTKRRVLHQSVGQNVDLYA